MSTQAEIGKHLDLSSRRISELVKKGILPPGKGKGGLDVNKCRVAYIRYLRGVASGQVDKKKDESIDVLKRRVSEATAVGLEIKNAKELKELVPVEILKNAASDMGEQINAIFDSIPLKIKRISPGLPATTIKAVKKELVKAKNAAANVRININ